MRKILWFLFSSALCFAQNFASTAWNAPISNTNTGWLLATFQNPIGAIGGGALSFYQGYNSYSLFPNGTPTYDCLGQGRDPSILQYSGKVLLAHTFAGAAGPCIPDQVHFAISNANNGTTTTLAFSNQIHYACPLAGYCWAPEWWADPTNCSYATGTGWTCDTLGDLHLYFANSTNVVCCSAFTIYETHPTASDFATNAASWSTAVALTFASGTPTPIDVQMACKIAATGADCVYHGGSNQYYIWYNDKSSSTGCINYGTIPAATGAITPVMTGNCYGFANYVEGPNIFKSVAGTPGTWTACFDPYNNTYDQGGRWCSNSTDNWSTWGPTYVALTPTQAKQGTVIPYP